VADSLVPGCRVNVAGTFSHFTVRGCVVIIGRFPVEINMEDVRVPVTEDDESCVRSRSELS
jgi:hypothetical protein